ncbi:MAG: hypothetical protein R3F59_15840 [Myxococcota bacterium]
MSLDDLVAGRPARPAASARPARPPAKAEPATPGSALEAMRALKRGK